MTETTSEKLQRLATACASPAPAETVAGHFHRAMRTPNEPEGWARLAALAEEVARLARHMEHLTTR